MRDSANKLAAYAARIDRLTVPPVQIIVAEGDSVDETVQALYEWRINDDRVKVAHCNTGLPRYGSVVNEERFSILSQVFNAALAKVDVKDSTHVLFLPDDIDYDADLLERLLAHDVDMIAPLVWDDWYGTPYFYDTWAFRRMGSGNFYNFSQAWARQNLGNALIEMESVGGTVLMRSTVVAAGCRYRAHDVDRGLCAMARDYGFGVWCDPTTHVRHGA